MSDNLSVMATTRLALVSEKRAERRQLHSGGHCAARRKKRSADAYVGSFDEIKMTQNASRKSIYFFTGLNRYYKGMRVRVAMSV